jgi:hypothetical protein
MVIPAAAFLVHLHGPALAPLAAVEWKLEGVSWRGEEEKDESEAHAGL